MLLCTVLQTKMYRMQDWDIQPKFAICLSGTHDLVPMQSPIHSRWYRVNIPAVCVPPRREESWRVCGCSRIGWGRTGGGLPTHATQGDRIVTWCVGITGISVTWSLLLNFNEVYSWGKNLTLWSVHLLEWWNFLALLDCVSRANVVARASVVRPSVRKPRFLRNRQAN